MQFWLAARGHFLLLYFCWRWLQRFGDSEHWDGQCTAWLKPSGMTGGCELEWSRWLLSHCSDPLPNPVLHCRLLSEYAANSRESPICVCWSVCWCVLLCVLLCALYKSHVWLSPTGKLCYEYMLIKCTAEGGGACKNMDVASLCLLGKTHTDFVYHS